MIKIAVNYEFHRDAFDCYVYREEGDSRVYQQPGDVWKTVRAEDVFKQIDLVPSFTLPRYLASALIEELAKQDITPRQQTMIEGKYEAQSKHLADLQHILQSIMRNIGYTK